MTCDQKQPCCSEFHLVYQTKRRADVALPALEEPEGPGINHQAWMSLRAGGALLPGPWASRDGKVAGILRSQAHVSVLS